VRDFVKSVEQTNTYYSATMAVLEDNMRKGGMGYASAVALEEQTVLELNKSGISTPLVAIYPREGTFVHDNPYIVLRAPWVTDDQRRAAALFKDFLLQPANQEKAVTLGFRPATTQVSWRADLFTQANGVDPDQPATTLQAPQPKVLVEVEKAWSGLRAGQP
jgi:Ca-activated chloride channel family protein